MFCVEKPHYEACIELAAPTTPTNLFRATTTSSYTSSYNSQFILCGLLPIYFNIFAAPRHLTTRSSPHCSISRPIHILTYLQHQHYLHTINVKAHSTLHICSTNTINILSTSRHIFLRHIFTFFFNPLRNFFKKHFHIYSYQFCSISRPIHILTYLQHQHYLHTINVKAHSTLLGGIFLRHIYLFRAT